MIGGVVADIWNVTAPYWFAFGGSLIILILVWPRLANLAEST